MDEYRGCCCKPGRCRIFCQVWEYMWRGAILPGYNTAGTVSTAFRRVFWIIIAFASMFSTYEAVLKVTNYKSLVYTGYYEDERVRNRVHIFIFLNCHSFAFRSTLDVLSSHRHLQSKQSALWEIKGTYQWLWWKCILLSKLSILTSHEKHFWYLLYCWCNDSGHQSSIPRGLF